MFLITHLNIGDDPYSYRARVGFIGVEPWAGGGGTVYLQGHPVIPNPWGNVSTNGTTTTTTTDITDKGGGDEIRQCIGGYPGSTMLCCVPPTKYQVNIECRWIVGIAYDVCYFSFSFTSGFDAYKSRSKKKEFLRSPPPSF